MPTEAQRPRLSLPILSPLSPRGCDSHRSPYAAHQGFGRRFLYTLAPPADGPLTGHRKGCWETTSHLSLDRRVCGGLPTQASPVPPKPGLDWPLGLVSAQSWAPRVPVLWDRDQILVHDSGDERKHDKRGSFVPHTAPSLPLGPFLREWHHHHGPQSQARLHSASPLSHSWVMLLSPDLGAGLRCLPWARPPHFPCKATQPPPWSHWPVPTQAGGSLPATALQPCPALLLPWLSPSTQSGTCSGPRGLPQVPGCPFSLFSPSRVPSQSHFPAAYTFLATVLARSLSTAFSPGQSPLKCRHTCILSSLHPCLARACLS